MAFTYVSTTAAKTAVTTVTSTTLPFASSGPSLNSFLVCAVFVDHSTTTPARTVSSITDTQGNTWMRAAQGTLSTTQFLNAEIWCCWWNKAAGANTLTITLSGAPTGWCAFVAEYTTTGGRGARPDVSGSATSTTASQTTLAIPTASAAEAGELVIATAGLHATSAVTLGTSSTGYTTRQTQAASSPTAQAAIYDKLSAAAAVETCTATFSSHRYEAGAIATFIEVPAVSGYALQVWQEPSLQNYYRLDETTGTTATDQLAHANGTYTNTPTLNQGGALTDSNDSNAAVTFDGVANYMSFANQVSADFSLECWFNSTGGQGSASANGWPDCAGFIGCEVGGYVHDFGLGLDAGGVICGGVGVGVFPDKWVSSPSGYNDGKWHHVVFTRIQSSSVFALYVDGGLIGTNTGDTSALNSATSLFVGQNGSGTRWLAGTVDEVAIYSSALSLATIQNHYNAGRFDNPTPVARSSSYYNLIRSTAGLLNYYSFDELASGIADNFGNGHGVHYTSSVSSTPTLTTGGIAGDSDSAISFTGTKDVRVPRQFSGDFSIEFWLNSTGGAGTGNVDMWQGQGLVQMRVVGGQADWGMTLGADGIIVFGTYDGSDHPCVSGTGWNNGSWHHVVATRVQSTGAQVLYIDGVSRATATGATIPLNTAAYIAIGRTDIDFIYLVGALDEVAFYSTALSSTTVAQHYNAGITATGIPTYWFFPFL